MEDFQDRGEAARKAAGIDGTAGDAQDIKHEFVPARDAYPPCLVCGLAKGHWTHE